MNEETSPHYQSDDEGIGPFLFEKNEDFLEFKSIDIQQEHASFIYSFCGVVDLSCTMIFPIEHTSNPIDLKNILLSIGMCILPWYWMGFACSKIKVSAGYLSNDQLRFWQEFYIDVLAEFYYINNLDSSHLVQVESSFDGSPSDHKLLALPTKPNPRVLVPLGGGKDSIVVHELLKQCNTQLEQCWMYVGDGYNEFKEHWRLGAIVRMTDIPVLQVAHEFNYQAFDRVRFTSLTPCGHPWAALVAFDSVLMAYLGDFNYIAVGNERSANDGNGVRHFDREVNHQYDKSFDFERKANAYISEYLVKEVHYFSALQHLWELQITKIFCQTPQYLPIFSSCNEMGSSSRWCAKCEKCCFVFLMVSAFVEPPMAWSIFGNNLFEEKGLLKVFKSLCQSGEKSFKPFECIGTAEEVKAAVILARKKYKREGLPADQYSPVILENLFQLVSKNCHENNGLVESLLSDTNHHHLLPNWLIDNEIKHKLI